MTPNGTRVPRFYVYGVTAAGTTTRFVNFTWAGNADYMVDDIKVLECNKCSDSITEFCRCIDEYLGGTWRNPATIDSNLRVNHFAICIPRSHFPTIFHNECHQVQLLGN